MPEDPPSHIYYKRSRFSSKLPAGRRYTPSHYWLDEVEPGLWRVGFTKFATRMLGDFVEHAFEPKLNDPVTVGQTIGWVEGVEINFLGAVLGLDIRRPALKLPGIGRLGIAAGA